VITFENEGWLSKREFAAAIGRSISMVDRLLVRKGIRYRLYDGRVMIAEAEAEAYKGKHLGPVMVGGRPRVLRDIVPAALRIENC
jgi:hypothetical protein